MPQRYQQSTIGVGIAFTLMASWATHLALWLGADLGGHVAIFVPLGVVLQTFLSTGLYITAHDAMHGSLCPSRHRLNDAMGRAAAMAFMVAPYRRMSRLHHLHHLHSATNADPDYDDRPGATLVGWYARFMARYVTVWQLIGAAVVFNLLTHVARLATTNVLLFWALPPLLSSAQLFVFGTYQPHRSVGTPRDQRHRARSSHRSRWGSFLACYHFDYHLEHHEHPGVPWWRLPTLRRTGHP